MIRGVDQNKWVVEIEKSEKTKKKEKSEKKRRKMKKKMIVMSCIGMFKWVQTKPKEKGKKIKSQFFEKIVLTIFFFKKLLFS